MRYRREVERLVIAQVSSSPSLHRSVTLMAMVDSARGGRVGGIEEEEEEGGGDEEALGGPAVAVVYSESADGDVTLSQLCNMFPSLDWEIVSAVLEVSVKERRERWVW